MQKINAKERDKIKEHNTKFLENIKSNNMFSNTKGITLVALIVTIIVMLIIAGITINTTVGGKGILGQSKKASRIYNESSAKDHVSLLITEYQIEKNNPNTGNVTFEDFLNKKNTSYEDNGDGTLNIFVDNYVITVDKDGTKIISAEKDGGVLPEVTAKAYLENGTEVTSESSIVENEYITITVENKKKLDSVDSIKVYNAGGKEITEKSESPIGDNKADASFKVGVKGKYIIKVKGTKGEYTRTKTISIEINNLPDAPVDDLQGTYKLYTIDGAEITNASSEKQSKEVITLKLSNIISYDKVDTEYVKLEKNGTEIAKITDNGSDKIIGDNSDKTGVASYYITENETYTATIAASKYGLQKTTTFDITINNIEKFEQKINYVSLYDQGDECTSITGGWTKYCTTAPWSYYNSYLMLDKNEKSMSKSLSGTKQIAECTTNNKISINDYSRILCCYKYKFSGTSVGVGFLLKTDYTNSDADLKQQSGETVNNSTVKSDWTKGFGEKDISKSTGEYWANLNVTNANATDGASVSGEFYGMYLVKSDDITGLSKYGSTNSEIINNSSLLLNDESAVEYMIKICTGDLMADALSSDTFMTALSNSKYKDTIYANEYWGKFLNMLK